MTADRSEGPAWLEAPDGRQVGIQGSCSLGRAESNQVQVPDDKVSRRHALIHAQAQNEFWVVDFGSRNGTYLNGQRVIQPTRLRAGDRLRIGGHEFVFHQADGLAHAAQATALTDATAADIRPARCWLLVADIIDSTRLVQDLPPEELPRLTGRWVAECKAVIEKTGGRINQFMGDGFFACWDDRGQNERSIKEALQALCQLQERARPSFRMALHVGRVTLGGVSVGEEERISGSEVHFVFRMEKLGGELGEARLLSAAAAERLKGLLATREVGRHCLSGFESPLPFYAL